MSPNDVDMKQTDKLPPILASPSAASSGAGGRTDPAPSGSHEVVLLPPLMPALDHPRCLSTDTDTDTDSDTDTTTHSWQQQAASPPPGGRGVFLTALPDHQIDEPPGRLASERWHAPHAAKRVGSYIRDLSYNIHMRCCSKCRWASTAGASVGAGGGVGDGGGGGGAGGLAGGGRRRSAAVAHAGGGGRTAHRKCSTLCVHLSTASAAARDGVGVDGAAGERGLSKTRGGGRDTSMAGSDWEPTQVPPADSSAICHLSIYHNRDFTQMSWEELMALLTTNFANSKEVSAKHLDDLQDLKQEIIKAIEEGHLTSKDSRLKWQNRKMILVLQISKLMRTRGIYRAVKETLSDNNARLRRLRTLLEVRAYRQVYAMKVDYLKSGCTLLRFTRIPGRLCGGINLYQACITLVIGRRWAMRVLERRLQRTKDQTTEVDAEIRAVLHYKFQELPEDKMRVANLLKRLEQLTSCFEDVRQQMTHTVETLYGELEAKRQRQIVETIVTTMDTCVDQQPDWAGLYDFNRCLTGLCDDMRARNALLRRHIAETRSVQRHKGRSEAEWRAWLLQERAPGQDGDGDPHALRIRRKTWLPI